MTVPPPQQGTDRVQALFQPLCSNWSRLCCQQENRILYKIRATSPTMLSKVRQLHLTLVLLTSPAPVHAHCPWEHRSEGGRKSTYCKNSQWSYTQGHRSTSAEHQCLGEHFTFEKRAALLLGKQESPHTSAQQTETILSLSDPSHGEHLKSCSRMSRGLKWAISGAGSGCRPVSRGNLCLLLGMCCPGTQGTRCSHLNI